MHPPCRSSCVVRTPQTGSSSSSSISHYGPLPTSLQLHTRKVAGSIPAGTPGFAQVSDYSVGLATAGDCINPPKSAAARSSARLAEGPSEEPHRTPTCGPPARRTRNGESGLGVHRILRADPRSGRGACPGIYLRQRGLAPAAGVIVFNRPPAAWSVAARTLIFMGCVLATRRHEETGAFATVSVAVFS